MQVKKKLFAVAPLLAGALYFAVNPQPLYAIFGFGDIVFDPTSYAQFTEIWGQDISNGAKLMETYNQTVKIVQNGLQVYNLAMQMSHRIQNKSVWETAAFAVGNEVTQNHYNETINFNAVMNGDVLHAGTAWQQSTRYGGNGGYLGNATAVNSSRMSEYATLQLLDQTSQRCATILANYKATQDANATPEQQLHTDALDETDAKNSMVAVLNVLSGGHIQMQTQTKALGNLQACLAEQQTLQAKVARDKLADQQIWYADVAAARASSPVDVDPIQTAGTIANYIIP